MAEYPWDSRGYLWISNMSQTWESNHGGIWRKLTTNSPLDTTVMRGWIGVHMRLSIYPKYSLIFRLVNSFIYTLSRNIVIHGVSWWNQPEFLQTKVYHRSVGNFDGTVFGLGYLWAIISIPAIVFLTCTNTFEILLVYTSMRSTLQG